MNSDRYNDLLSALSFEQKAAISEIHSTLKRNGRSCYLVGGCVRDLLLNRPVKDIDLTTDARPQEVQKMFKRTVPTGIKHGTVTVLIKSLAFEVTTFRAESGYSDGRHPDQVAFSDSLSEDLKRRDFTINALCFEPGAHELIDEHQGLADLEKRLIRTIGAARERFTEDGLRPVRACRFCSTLDFELEDETRETLALPEIHKRSRMVAVERFTDELWKGFRADRVSKMLDHLLQSGLLPLFIEPTDNFSVEKNRMIDELSLASPYYKMATWLQSGNFTGEDLHTLGRTLKFSNQQVKLIDWSQRFNEFILNAENQTDNNVSIRRFLSGLKGKLQSGSQQFLEDIPANCYRDFSSAQFIEILRRDPLTISDLEISGKELLDRGFNGPAVGAALELALEAVLENPGANSRSQLLDLVTTKKAN